MLLIYYLLWFYSSEEKDEKKLFKNKIVGAPVIPVFQFFFFFAFPFCFFSFLRIHAIIIIIKNVSVLLDSCITFLSTNTFSASFLYTYPRLIVTMTTAKVLANMLEYQKHKKKQKQKETLGCCWDVHKYSIYTECRTSDPKTAYKFCYYYYFYVWKLQIDNGEQEEQHRGKDGEIGNYELAS